MKKLLQKAMFLLLAFAFPTMTFADIYVTGNSTELTWVLPGTRYETNQDGVYILELNNASMFRFSSVETDNWDEFNDNSFCPTSDFTDEVYSEKGQTLSLMELPFSSEPIAMPWRGDYTITINLNDMSIKAQTTKPQPITPVYIRGDMNEWNSYEDWKMQYDEENDCYTFDCSGKYVIPANAKFKFADAEWGEINFGYDRSYYHRLFPGTELTVDLKIHFDNTVEPIVLAANFSGRITFKITGYEQAYAIFTPSKDEYMKDYFVSEGILYKTIDNFGHTLSVVQPSNDNNSLKTINIPQTVEFNNIVYTVEGIESNAFAYYDDIEEVTLPLTLKHIGDGAFYNCTSLASINLPQGITSIADRTFSGCSSLSSVKFPDGVISIGSSAFAHCSGLSSVKLNDALTKIGNGAFQRCGNLTAIELSKSLETIDEMAFENCLSLQYIKIPASVVSIGITTFNGCGGLRTIIVEEGNNIYDSRNNCNAIIETNTNTLVKGCQSTVIPDSVTSIGVDAFYGCLEETNIDIPTSINYIGYHAFAWCYGLSVSVYAPNPPVCEVEAFWPNDVDTLHVPVGTKEVYASATGWSVFNNIIDDLKIGDEEGEDPEIPTICVAMNVSDNKVELAVNEEMELTISLKGLKVGTSTLTLTLTDENGEETTETVVISVVKDTTDVEAIFAGQEETLVNIYNLNGTLLKTMVRPEAVLELPKGIYIVGDKKVLVK